MDTSLIPIYLVIAVPIALVVNYIYKAYQASIVKQENLKRGIGRGVAGIQTGVRRVAIPADIMERIRRGEEVSGEEITRAQERMAAASSSSGSSQISDKKAVDGPWSSESNSKSKRSDKKAKPRKR